MSNVVLLLACWVLALHTAVSAAQTNQGVSADDAASTAALRILSLSPHITETLFFLGAGNQVVGVTEYCNFPEAAKSKTRVGSYLNPSLETMLSLEPTTAFFSPGQASIHAELNRAGVVTHGVPSNSLSDIRTGITLIGRKIGRPKAAKQVLAEFDASLAQAVPAQPTAEGQPTEQPRVLMVLGGPEGGQIFGIGPNTFLDELLRLCQAQNWLHNAGTSYPSVSREFNCRAARCHSGDSNQRRSFR